MTGMFSTWPPATFEIVGVAGFLLYVVNYALLTFQRLRSQDTGYFILNFLAASMVLFGLMHSWNLASALIQIFWIAISIAAVAIRLGKSRRPQSRAAAPDVMS